MTNEERAFYERTAGEVARVLAGKATTNAVKPGVADDIAGTASTIAVALVIYGRLAAERVESGERTLRKHLLEASGG